MASNTTDFKQVNLSSLGIKSPTSIQFGLDPDGRRKERKLTQIPAYFFSILRKSLFSNTAGIYLVDLSGTMMRADRGRYYYLFLKCLELGMRSTTIPLNLNLLKIFGTRYGRLILNDTELTSSLKVSLVDNHHGILISDQECSQVMLSRERSNLMFPVMMHPLIYGSQHSTTRALIATQRNETNRPFGVVFAGNTSANIYKDIEFEGEIFASRKKILDSLKGIVNFLDSIPESRQVRASFILGMDGTRIKQEKMIRMLLGSDFFLALPGATIPFCHNIAEAMACGAIPITNYGHLFCPPLRDKVECISFDGADARSALKRALELQPAEAIAMRRRVLAYYDAYMSPVGFIQLLEKELTLTGRAKVYYPYR